VPDTERLGVLSRRERSCKILCGMGTWKKGKNMNYYALFYDVVDNFVRGGPHTGITIFASLKRRIVAASYSWLAR
jgi:hypothetical protein